MTVKKKPEWAPEKSGDEFASYVIPPVVSVTATPKHQQQKSKHLDLTTLAEKILQSDRYSLAKAITLIESNKKSDQRLSQQLLKSILPHTGNSIRIALTGAPGAGKSTLIESLGNYLCNLGHKVAVLAIDPSSNRSGGSILGDKTRMEILSRNQNAFIRPSPSSGNLGGVAKKTRESILLCEAAGYDVIIVETIGVGQSEITARSMVDFYLLVLLPGEGDELQGIKKGSVELADCLVINKADGNNTILASITKSSYEQALHYVIPATAGWTSKVLTASALNNEGLENIWETVREFSETTQNSGIFLKRRKSQIIDWMYNLLDNRILSEFYENDYISQNKTVLEKRVLEGELTPAEAVEKFFELRK